MHTMRKELLPILSEKAPPRNAIRGNGAGVLLNFRQFRRQYVRIEQCGDCVGGAGPLLDGKSVKTDRFTGEFRRLLQSRRKGLQKLFEFVCRDSGFRIHHYLVFRLDDQWKIFLQKHCFLIFQDLWLKLFLNLAACRSEIFGFEKSMSIPIDA